MGHAFEQVWIEFPAGDRGDYQQRLRVFWKAVDPAEQDVTDAARHIECEYVISG